MSIIRTATCYEPWQGSAHTCSIVKNLLDEKKHRETFLGFVVNQLEEPISFVEGVRRNDRHVEFDSHAQKA